MSNIKPQQLHTSLVLIHLRYETKQIEVQALSNALSKRVQIYSANSSVMELGDFDGEPLCLAYVALRRIDNERERERERERVCVCVCVCVLTNRIVGLDRIPP
jgi:hypothetical protein